MSEHIAERVAREYRECTVMSLPDYGGHPLWREVQALTAQLRGKDMLSGIKKAVFFGAHTDDEFICAGTLHRLACAGCEVHVVTFGPAATKDDRRGTYVSSEIVLPEWHQSLDVIGIRQEHRQFHGMRDGYLPSAEMPKFAEEICQDVYDYCESVKPDLALILSPHDENTAHAVVGVACERVMRGRVAHVWRCLFPWNFSTDKPNLYVKLESEDMEAKRAVINCYQSQKFRYDYESILMHYAVADGLAVKVPAAEKFEVVRSVV